jgi:RNA polymerase sigma-70 factor (ECF subfamily)
LKEAWDSGRDPLEALRDGDPGPFEAFVRAESPTFAAFFLRLGAGRTEAEDLTQDVFLRLFRHAASYQAQDRFTAFAFRTARNAWIDHGRRRAVRPSPAAGGESDEREPGPADRAPGPAEALERGEEARRVSAALAGLAEPHRLVFELGVLQGLAYAEIAAALAIPVGTVKSRMHHAVRKLRAALGEAEGGAA